MLREPFGSSDLLLPSEPVLRILPELDVVRRIGVDKIVWLQRNGFEVHVSKFEPIEGRDVVAEVCSIVDTLVAAEWHVELAALVEPAQSVVPRSIEVIEKSRG